MSDPTWRGRDLDELKENLLGIFAGAAPTGSVRLPDGSTLTVDRDPRGDALVRIDVEGAVFQSFPAADSRPDGYPADLPFVPGLPVAVEQISADKLALQWFVVPDPPALAAEIEKMLQRDGWERTEVAALPAPPATIATFARDDMERTLMTGGPMAMLLQERKTTC